MESDDKRGIQVTSECVSNTDSHLKTFVLGELGYSNHDLMISDLIKKHNRLVDHIEESKVDLEKATFWHLCVFLFVVIMSLCIVGLLVFN